MRSVTIARNYAEALFELGETHGQSELYAELLDAVAAALREAPSAQAVMMSPRVTKAEKARLLGAALPGAPRPFVLFLTAIVKRNRQVLIPDINVEYTTLVDVKLNRVRAGVTLAREPDAKLRKQITQALEQALGKEALISFTGDPGILGGAVVRIGERVHDGSVRRRITALRRKLLAQ